MAAGVRRGDEWGLLAATMDGGYFNGYRAFQLRDVREVRWDTSFESRFKQRLPVFYRDGFAHALDKCLESGFLFFLE